MYKTINKVFSSGGGKGKGDRPSFRSSSASDRSSGGGFFAAAAASVERNSESPRVGSPSAGEGTLKKLVRKLFPDDAVAVLGASKVPKGKVVRAEMLAFEISSIMRRMLEIYDSMSETMLASLRSNLQVGMR